LYEEENYFVWNISFYCQWRVASPISPSHEVVPELLELLTVEETQILVRHQEQADRTLGALDAMMTRSLTTRQQHEFIL
jgi:hypothetical protein